MSDASLELLESLAVAGIKSRGVAEPCEMVRAITAGDIPTILDEMREHNWSKLNAVGVDPVRVLRVGHHQLAQLLASGVSEVDASLITGRGVGTIKSLKKDPAFNELLAYYATQQEMRDVNVYDKLVTIGALASEILQERLEESPERFTNSELKQLLEIAAPAKGVGASGTQHAPGLNVNINFVKSRAQDDIPGALVEVREVKQIEEIKRDEA